MNIQKKIIIGLSVVALFGTMTNYVFFSPLLTLLFPLAIFVFNKKKLPKPIFWLYAYLGLFLLSAVWYDLDSLLQFGFYRRDGNFMISYAPLFVLPLFQYAYDFKKYIRQFYIFTICVYSLLFIIHIFTINNIYYLHDVVFGGLFIAQNAVGGFLAILGGLGIAYFNNSRSKKELILFGVVFVMLLATYSRGSILGLLLGIIAWYLTKTKRFKLLIASIVVPVLLTAGAVMIGYPFFKQAVGTQEVVKPDIENISSKNANILIRIFYSFPHAYYMFSHSPVIGTGVGSYNDQPIEFKEVLPHVKYNAQPQKTFSDAHAHHSYLHILGEQGILGLGVFLTFWISLFFYLIRIRGDTLMKDFLLISYFTLTFAAFTEHRITTPSNMLPFTIILGMFMMQKEKMQIYRLKKAA